MVLVFALAAALCLQVFAFSDQASRRNAHIDRAVLLAQNTAEILKACGGIDGASALLGGESREKLWRSYYDEDLMPTAVPEDARYRVDVYPESSPVTGLAKANIEVFQQGEAAKLFSVPVAWQEVDRHG